MLLYEIGMVFQSPFGNVYMVIIIIVNKFSCMNESFCDGCLLGQSPHKLFVHKPIYTANSKETFLHDFLVILKPSLQN